MILVYVRVCVHMEAVPQPQATAEELQVAHPAAAEATATSSFAKVALLLFLWVEALHSGVHVL